MEIKKPLTPELLRSRVASLESHVLARDFIIVKLVRIQRKTLSQMKRAAKRLKDPEAVKLVEETDAEFKEIQQLVRNVKKNIKASL